MPFEVHGEPADYNWQNADDARGVQVQVQNQAGEPGCRVYDDGHGRPANEIARNGEAEPCQDEKHRLRSLSER